MTLKWYVERGASLPELPLGERAPPGDRDGPRDAESRSFDRDPTA